MARPSRSSATGRGQNNLWLMDADGSSPRQVFSDMATRAVEPAWSADGEYIFVKLQDVAAGRGQTGRSGIWMLPHRRRRRDPGGRGPAAGRVAIAVRGWALPVLPRLHGPARVCRDATRSPGTGRCGARTSAPARSSTSRPGTGGTAGTRLERQRLRGRDLPRRSPSRLRPTDRGRHDLVPGATASALAPRSGSATSRPDASASSWIPSPSTTQRGSRRCASSPATVGAPTDPAS